MDLLAGRPFEIKQSVYLDKKTKLKKVLSKPIDQRTEAEIYEVTKILKDNQFLAKFSATSQLFELVRHMALEKYQPMDLVFNQGDHGDSFYIIHSGRVAIYKKQKTEFIKVRELINGQSFGELALLQGETRKAKVVAVDKTYLVALKKEPFDRIVKQSEAEQIQKVHSFMKSIPALKKVPRPVLERFSQIIFFKKFKAGSFIIKQGQSPPGIYAIFSGNVKLIRKFPMKLVSSLRKKVKSPRKVKSKIVIDDLSRGDLLCDYEYFNKEPMQYSVLCNIPVTCLFYDKEALLEADPLITQEIKKVSKPYPSDSELQKIYLETYNWTKYKQNILRSISVEREMKK